MFRNSNTVYITFDHSTTIFYTAQLLWCFLNQVNPLQQINTAMDHGYPPPSSRTNTPYTTLKKGPEELIPSGREKVSQRKKPSL